jgi:hypothetical protein
VKRLPSRSCCVPAEGALVPRAVAAELLGVPVDTVDDLIVAGAARVHRIRNRLYVDLDDLERAIRRAPSGGGQ